MPGPTTENETGKAVQALRWQIKSGLRFGMHENPEGIKELIALGLQLADLLDGHAGERAMLETYELTIDQGKDHFVEDVPFLLDVLIFSAENHLRQAGINPD